MQVLYLFFVIVPFYVVLCLWKHCNRINERKRENRHIMEASAAHGPDTKASTVDTEPAIPSSKRRTRLQFAEGDDARRNNFVVDLGMQMLGDFTDRMLLQEEEKMDSEASSGQAQKILDCVRNMMSGRNPQELFYDWSPPRSLPLEPINSEEVTLSASSTDDTSAVDKVLAGPGCKAWLSDKGAGQGSYLQTTFPTCPVGGLSFCFPGKNRASSQVEIMIAQVKKRESNSVAEKTEEESLRWISLGTVEGSSIPSNKKDAKPCSITLPFIRCCGIKLNLTGFASDNTDKQHGISELSVFRAHPRSVTPSSSTVISAYEEILKNISLCTNSADVIPTMQQCATATAALSSQITLADVRKMCSFGLVWLSSTSYKWPVLCSYRFYSDSENLYLRLWSCRCITLPRNFKPIVMLSVFASLKTSRL